MVILGSIKFRTWTEIVIPMLSYEQHPKKPIGSLIQLHRKSAGLTLTSFSKLTRVSSTHIYHIERSHRTPSNFILHTFERVLELKPGELISHQGQSTMDFVSSFLSNQQFKPIIFPYRVTMIKDDLMESITKNLLEAKRQIHDRLLEF